MTGGAGAAAARVTSAPAHLPPAEQARLHLKRLFPAELQPGEWLELRCLNCRVDPATPGPRLYVRSIPDLVDAAMVCRHRWDVFFGVGLRRCPTNEDILQCRHPSRGADHVSRLSALWGDFDIASAEQPDKPHPSLSALEELLHATSPRPSLLVHSGHGVHAYWPLHAPTADLARAEAVNRGIAARLHGDNAIDRGRILRLAGTRNFKFTPPAPVRLLEALP